VFYDDYLSLADDETTFGAKSDNYLKVCIHSHITYRDPFNNFSRRRIGFHRLTKPF